MHFGSSFPYEISLTSQTIQTAMTVSNNPLTDLGIDDLIQLDLLMGRVIWINAFLLRLPLSLVILLNIISYITKS